MRTVKRLKQAVDMCWQERGSAASSADTDSSASGPPASPPRPRTRGRSRVPGAWQDSDAPSTHSSPLQRGFRWGLWRLRLCFCLSRQFTITAFCSAYMITDGLPGIIFFKGYTIVEYKSQALKVLENPDEQVISI